MFKSKEFYLRRRFFELDELQDNTAFPIFAAKGYKNDQFY
ncbi:hypothetical protein ACVWYN_002446 [Pedobacter sp. UYP24]